MSIPVLPRFQCVFQAFLHTLSSYTSDHTFPTACCWGVEHATDANVELESDDGIFMSAKPVKRPEERNIIVWWGRVKPYRPQFAVRAAESTQKPTAEPSPCKEM